MIVCALAVTTAMVFLLFEVAIRVLYSYSLAGYKYMGMQPLFYVAAMTVLLTAGRRSLRIEEDAL